MSRYQVLVDSDVEQFLTKGFVAVRGCFSRQAAKEFTQPVWDRLGYAADTPSTWAEPVIHLAGRRQLDVAPIRRTGRTRSLSCFRATRRSASSGTVQTGRFDTVRLNLSGKQQAAVEYGVGALAGGVGQIGDTPADADH